ncbi:MAG TPA: AAA family ATPase [Methanomassiliicoccales archaeon]|nr:AAA family ATPase [Methanomassiliicoccales archaeon]HPR99098.1 AAA family ATPase [Methanomassiliicoccales archaeon]
MGVLILTGMPGAGKEELVSVALELGYQVRRMGDVVRAEALRNGIPPQEVGKFAHEERQRHGYDIWAKRIVPLVGEGDTLIDGCRGMSEVSVFREAFGTHVKVMAVHSSPSTRFPRLVSRGRSDAPRDRQEFDERDKRELSWGLGETIALADALIVNESTLERFRADAFVVLRELKG